MRVDGIVDRGGEVALYGGTQWYYKGVDRTHSIDNVNGTPIYFTIDRRCGVSIVDPRLRSMGATPMEGTYWQNPIGMPMMAATSDVSALALMAGWEKERAAMNGDPWLVSVSLMFPHQAKRILPSIGTYHSFSAPRKMNAYPCE